MTSVFSSNFEIYNAESFKRSLEDTVEPFVYITIGKSTAWDDDTAPPQANTSLLSFADIWRNMIAAKRLSGQDARLAIPRHNWSSGTVYTAYSHELEDLCDYEFFVVTDEWNVYKCLANNNDQPSTVKPTTVQTENTIQTADKYIWKYMYTVSEEERLRYVTDNYIPVRTLQADNGSLQWQVQTNAIDGGLNAIKIIQAGDSFVTANTITVTITGDGNSATATPILNGDAIESILITNPGSGYTYAEVAISDTAGGANAIAKAIISPPGGHGSDPVTELCGSNVIINARIRGSEGQIISTENEFRQVALISNPLLLDSTTVASNLVYNQTMVISLDVGVTDYQLDEFVYQGGSLATSTFSGKVVSWDTGNNLLRLVNITGTPVVGPVYGETSTATRLLRSFTERSLQPYSGKLLYIDNIAPIQRADDQTEDFKIVVKF